MAQKILRSTASVRVFDSRKHSTASSRRQSILRCNSTRWKPSCSESAAKVTSSARTNSISAYAITRQKLLCLDAGHFHPTENVADKISSTLPFVPGILLHLSRGVRWDSDHVVLLDDPTRAMLEEIVRGGFLSRAHLGLDYFDASINRLAAWVIGARNTQKALLLALLEPAEKLRSLELAGDFTNSTGVGRRIEDDAFRRSMG